MKSKTGPGALRYNTDSLNVKPGDSQRVQRSMSVLPASLGRRHLLLGLGIVGLLVAWGFLRDSRPLEPSCQDRTIRQWMRRHPPEYTPAVQAMLEAVLRPPHRPGDAERSWEVASARARMGSPEEARRALAAAVNSADLSRRLAALRAYSAHQRRALGDTLGDRCDRSRCPAGLGQPLTDRGPGDPSTPHIVPANSSSRVLSRFLVRGVTCSMISRIAEGKCDGLKARSDRIF